MAQQYFNQNNRSKTFLLTHWLITCLHFLVINSNIYKFKSIIILQMFRDQAYQSQPVINKSQVFNWTSIDPYWNLNYCQNSYFMPFSTFTGPDLNMNLPYFYLFPLSNGAISVDAPRQIANISGGEPQRAIQLNIAQKKSQIETSEVKKQQKKRRKIIELENIKDNERNRNILSNCLKLALKNIRNSFKESDSYFMKIVRTRGLQYTQAEFEEKLNKLLPYDINYIRPAMMRQIFEKQCPKFTIVFKIFIRKFFKEQIYASTGKYTQMKKLIKSQHIKAGRKLISYFFEQELESDINIEA